MNCKNFEAVISDLAREQMLEAQTRESALAHTQECTQCLQMLEDERALTASLRSLATSMSRVEAPASIEANLLAKFRERTVSAQPSPVVIQMPQRAASGWKRWYPHAVAAAVVIMFAIGGAGMLRLRQAAPAPPESETTIAGGKAPDRTTPVSSNTTTEAPAASEDEPTTIASAEGGNESAETGRKLSPKEVDVIMGTNAARRPPYTNIPKSKVRESRLASTSGEIATDFMPVSYGDNLNEIDNGRIIRVEMPRSALAQFGIPVNMERANERIKADVLIGDDGMARAIRFVR